MAYVMTFLTSHIVRKLNLSLLFDVDAISIMNVETSKDVAQRCLLSLTV